MVEPAAADKGLMLILLPGSQHLVPLAPPRI